MSEVKHKMHDSAVKAKCKNLHKHFLFNLSSKLRHIICHGPAMLLLFPFLFSLSFLSQMKVEPGSGFTPAFLWQGFSCLLFHPPHLSASTCHPEIQRPAQTSTLCQIVVTFVVGVKVCSCEYPAYCFQKLDFTFSSAHLVLLYVCFGWIKN